MVEVIKAKGEIPVDPESPFWNSPEAPKPVTVELGPQMITNPKWPDPSIKNVRVRAVHNGSELAVVLEWKDSSQDADLEFSAKYADQAALMFPLNPKAEPPPIPMGSESDSVNIWQWKAAWEKNLDLGKRNRNWGTSDMTTPMGKDLMGDNHRASPVEDLNAVGFSTLTTQENQDVKGKGVWKDGSWRVVFKRALVNDDENDAQFTQSTQMAIAVWNGSNRETNGQKGVALWLLLKFG